MPRPPWASDLATLIFVVLLLATCCRGLSPGTTTKRTATIHTAVPTECGLYFDWQSIGMVYSHRKARQPGPLTRIVSCSPETWEAMSKESKSIVQTHVAPNYATHPRTGDRYAAYNKPMAVIDWLAKTDVKEDYVLIIDADMIMRRPILPDPSSPLATSAFFGYMIGVNNELALKHVPEVTPRQDELAGPKGRRGDKAGGFTMMRTEQLRKVAPLWLQYTEDVRADPDAWKLTGDHYATKPGDKPWISEMYGYSFACAKADVWHKTPLGMMLYPGYDAQTAPHVLHYGLLWHVDESYAFDKHWHYNFNPFLCPPWDLEGKAANATGDRPQRGGLFPHPPSPGSFKTSGLGLFKDLLAVEPVITLNAALCERHLAKCSPSPELTLECAKAKSLETELDERVAELLPKLSHLCQNSHQKCEQWAMGGECTKNPNYMRKNCAKACNFCVGGSDEGQTAIETDDHAIEKEQVAGRVGGDTADAADESEEIYDADTYDEEDEYAFHDGDQSIEATDDARDTADQEQMKRLFDRCRENVAIWTAHQAAECVKLAKSGIEYRIDAEIDESGDESRSFDLTAKSDIHRGENQEQQDQRHQRPKETLDEASLVSIIASSLTLKEKLLLGACGSYLTWYIVMRRRGGTVARMSRFRKQQREKNDRLPTRF